MSPANNTKQDSKKEHIWKIHVKDLEIFTKIGIHEHEKKKQRILVNIEIDALYPYRPKDISQCFDYEKIVKYINDKWDNQEQKYLLEHCVTELMDYAFNCDERIINIKIGINKPDIFSNVKSLEVETVLTRDDFVKLHVDYQQ
ncbi:MAG: dihydroneopterin aldolase [Rickettsiales bacterium]